MTIKETPVPFRELGLDERVLFALQEENYEVPTEIQAQAIPVLLEGGDIIGQARTGTGKTAAFALPLLSRIDITRREPQVLLLAPTRELAIQVADSFVKYGRFLKGMKVCALYGGQSMDIQLRALQSGPQVIVGTPGRVMDLLRRKALKTDSMAHFVLDEADEMLRMGFIDDVECILQQVPEERQIALFSATMPPAIRKVARTYLHEPTEISIASRENTAENIRQRYWVCPRGMHKSTALNRVLEGEDFQAALIFVRTKAQTQEIADLLSKNGHKAEALNGDIQQRGRERIVERMKAGMLRIVVATDVAARGLDVDSISLVVNYDVPFDTESYVHRIGRTGRAGRKGDAILFLTRREQNMLRSIEKATHAKLEEMRLPTVNDINLLREQRFMDEVCNVMDTADLKQYEKILGRVEKEQFADPIKLAAALFSMHQNGRDFYLDETTIQPPKRRFDREGGRDGGRDGGFRERSGDKYGKRSGGKSRGRNFAKSQGGKPAKEHAYGGRKKKRSPAGKNA